MREGERRPLKRGQAQVRRALPIGFVGRMTGAAAPGADLSDNRHGRPADDPQSEGHYREGEVPLVGHGPLPKFAVALAAFAETGVVGVHGMVGLVDPSLQTWPRRKPTVGCSLRDVFCGFARRRITRERWPLRALPVDSTPRARIFVCGSDGRRCREPVESHQGEAQAGILPESALIGRLGFVLAQDAVN